MGPKNDDPDETITPKAVSDIFSSLGESGLDNSNRLFFAMCDQGKNNQQTDWAKAFGIPVGNVFGHAAESLEPIDFQFVLSVLDGKPILNAWNEAVKQVQEANTISANYMNHIFSTNPTFYLNNYGTVDAEAADYASHEIIKRYNIDY